MIMRKSARRWTVHVLIFAMVYSLFWEAGAAGAEPEGAEPVGSVTADIFPSDDTYVNDGAANENNNYGTAATLRVKNMQADRNVTRQSFLKFDLQEVSGPVQSATLAVYGQVTDGAGNQVDIQLHEVDNNSWTESTMTWKNKPALREVIGSFTAVRPAQWYEVDVTDYIRKQTVNGGIASIGLKQSAPIGLVVDLNSKENSVYPPRLKVVYEPSLDQSAPVWPDGSELSAITASPAGVELEWSAALDDVSVVMYRVFINDQPVGETGGLVRSFRTKSLIGGLTYTFRVEAKDATGQWSEGGPQLVLTLPETASFVPLDDAYVNNGNSNMNNYGSAERLLVKNVNSDPNVTRQAFLKFDTAPYRAEVGTAVLHLYGAVTDGGGSVIDTQVYGVEDLSWQEAMVTWLTKPDADHYLGTFKADKTWKWHQVDVTSYVKKQRELGLEQISFGLLQEAANGLVIQLHSKENSQYHPYLEISSDRQSAQAPSWPVDSFLAASHIREDGVDLNWSEAGVGETPDRYRILQNGSEIGIVPGTETEYSINGLQVGGRYTFKVEASYSSQEWSLDGPYLTVALPRTELKQTRLGNVFLQGEQVQFELHTLKPSAEWTIRNMAGAVKAAGSVNPQNGMAVIEPSQIGPGYYTLEVSVNEEGSSSSMFKTTFAILSPFDIRAVADSPFGIAAHLHRTAVGWDAALAELIAKAGAGSARGGMEWGSIEKTKGEYTFTPQPDFFMKKLETEGVRPLFVSAYNNPFYDNNATPYTQEGREGFAGYADAYVEHYKDQLYGIQVYNEFNGGFGKRGDSPADSRPDYYFELLVETYNRIKASNPEMPVIGIATAGIPLNWIEEVFKRGGLDYMDVVAVHPYRYPQAPEGMEVGLRDLQNLIKKYNGGELKPIWITEIGWPTHQTASGVDEKTQADYAVRSHVVALANGVEKVYWYNLMNDGLTADYNEHNFGLIRFAEDPLGAYVPKPAYVSYSVMTRELTGASFENQESWDPQIRSYRFQKNNESLRVIWSVSSEPVQAALKTNQPVSITDLSGITETYYPLNGSIYLTLNGEPVYVKGDIADLALDKTFAIDGEDHFTGEPVSFKVKIDNQTGQALSVCLEAEGESYPISVSHLEDEQQMITIPEAVHQSYRRIDVYLKSEGRTFGHLRYEVQTLEARKVQVRPMLNELENGGYEKSLNVVVNNFSKYNELPISRLSWQVNGQTGSRTLNTSVEPEGSEAIQIPVTGVDTGQNVPVQVKLEYTNASGLSGFEYKGNLNFQPIQTEFSDIPDIDLSEGTVKLKDYAGVDDLSGKVWLRYDDDHFYLKAEIRDDIHAAPSKGEDIWNNDGIQFGLSYGIPGESKEWFEYGIADTPEGPQVYRWKTAGGLPDGIVSSVQASVTRQEEEKLTTYELALPWSELAGILPAAGESVSFSLLVNDHDGNGRRGWIEWASGIGSSKQPSLYRSFQWIIEPDPHPPIEEPGGGSGPEPEVPPVSVNPGNGQPAPGTESPGNQATNGGILLQPGAGGKVSLGKGIQIDIPEGADPRALRITIQELDEIDALLQPGQVILSSVYEVLKSQPGFFKKPVKLKLQYDPSLLRKGQEPVLFYLDEKSVQWVPMESQHADGYVTAETDHFTKFAVFAVSGQEADSGYHDLNNHWASAWIEQAVQQGIVKGYPDGSFRPDAELTRVEFAVMLARALALPQAQRGDTGSFQDESSIPLWAREDVGSAVSAGILQGYPDHSFGPERNIRRVEIAVMLVRAVENLTGVRQEKTGGVQDTGFQDDARIPQWAKSQVTHAVKMNLIQGRSGNWFVPLEPATRAEAVIIVLRLLEHKI
ncbi:DNRLRE domain-containing protein [Paenibacillus sp. BR1-192]|uniref:CBM96 family carbohydrate-binding protein n=1 Tax=Paenibacillus sp. BR1-192 TaxID=3032287 RepID=UPI00240DBBA2|nr:DNRLRE domain-containing protein [Paenibacillus sp. BR1-192]WFB61580.1 DNRLRE domain-containing protein [Paenibacillus sp. BR1-192]